ncbi:MAG: dipeptidase [Rhodobacteraceae bacterium]|nr:dipeptidase [Paracoccaceae bacterium]
MNTPLIFDGHNDVLLKQFLGGRAARTEFSTGNDFHIDVPKAKAGGFGGGFFAIWVPSPLDEGGIIDQMMQPEYDIPMPPKVEQGEALGVAMKQARMLAALESDGALKICTSVADITKTMQSGTMAAIMHMEGAEPIDRDLDALHVLYRAGLRSLGPVWSRTTIFAEGVPFRFPSTGDTGPGLSPAGYDLVRECNALGIMLDMSHLNEKGFWNVVETSDAPIVATHSNAYEICPHARNLTDDQLRTIGQSGGMVGLNFATGFLRPDGQMKPEVPLEIMLRHLDHMISLAGEDHVGLGSDFDGATVPEAIGDISGLPNLRAAMVAHGYDDALMEKLCFGNWLALLERTWKP